MVLISINKVYYERSYDLLKLNTKNNIIFAPTKYYDFIRVYVKG